MSVSFFNLKSCLSFNRVQKAKGRKTCATGKHRRLSLESLEERALLAVLMVNSTADTEFVEGQTTLRDAVRMAVDGDTVEFDSSLSGQEIHLLKTLEISKSIAIDGMSLWNSADDFPGITVGDNNADQLIQVTSGSSVTVSGLRITGGNAEHGGAFSVVGANLELNSCVLTENTGVYGGAIYMNNSADFFSHLTINDSVLTTNNHFVVDSNVVRYGGAIYVGGGELTMTNTVVSENRAEYGGGIYLSDAGQTVIGDIVELYDVVASIVDSQIIGNIADELRDHAGGYGGGIYINGVGAGTSALLTLTGSVVSGNIASMSGGGVYNHDATLATSEVMFSGNKAKNEGGGLFLDSGSTSLDYTTIAGNIAGDLLDHEIGCGGGIYSAAGFNASNTLVVDNYRLDGYECNVYPVGAMEIIGENNVFSTVDAPQFVSAPSYMVGWTSDLWKGFDLRLTIEDVDRFGDIGAHFASNESETVSFDLTNTEVNQSRKSGTTIGSFFGVDTYTYVFVSGAGSDDNSLFTLTDGVLVNGVLTDGVLTDNANLAGTYSIRVRATDALGFWSEKVFSINIIETIVVFTVNDSGDVPETIYDAATGTMVANPNFNPADLTSLTLREAVAAVNALEAEGKQDTIVFDSSLRDESGNVAITLCYGPVTISNSLYIINAEMNQQVATLEGWTPTVSIICGDDVFYSADNEALGSYNPGGDLFIVDSADGDVSFNGIELIGRKEVVSTYTDITTPNEGGYTGTIPEYDSSRTRESALLFVTTLEDIIDPYDFKISLREAVEIYSREGVMNYVVIGWPCAGETLTLKSSLVVSKNVYISTWDGTILRADGSFTDDYMFSVRDGVSLSILGLKIDGNSVAGGVYNRGLLQMAGDDRYFSHCVADNGGAIYNVGRASLVNTHFFACAATYNGGAIYNLGTLEVNGDSSFSYGAAGGNGGAIYNGLGGKVTSIRCDYLYNEAGGTGGAVYNLGEFQSNSCSFSYGTATLGSAFYNGASLSCISNSYVNNYADGKHDLYDVESNGTVYNREHRDLGLTLSYYSNSNCYFNNSVGNGNGWHGRGWDGQGADYGYWCVDNGNNGDHGHNGNGNNNGNGYGNGNGNGNGNGYGYGNGYNDGSHYCGGYHWHWHHHHHHNHHSGGGGSVDIQDNAVLGNGTGLIVAAGSNVTFNAGTIAGFNNSGIKNSGQLAVSNSRISGNVGNLGAGIYSDGELTVTGSAVMGNLALDLYDADGRLISEAAGAGIYIAADGTVRLANATVAGNALESSDSTLEAAGLCALGTAHLANTLVVQNYTYNTEGVSEEKNVGGAGYSATSLVRSIVTEGAAVEFNAIGDFANLGGSDGWGFDMWQSWNLASVSASVVDQGTDAVFGEGSDLRWDLNGLARFAGSSIDIGAYEYQAVSTLTLSNDRILQQYVGYVGDVSVYYDSTYIGENDLPVEYTYSYTLDDSMTVPEGIVLSNDRFTLTENGTLAVIEPGLASGYYYVGVRADYADGVAGESNTAIFTITVMETPSTVVTTTEDVVDLTDGLISLREAVEIYGGRYDFAGNDVVTFDLDDSTGYVITLNSSIHFTVDLEIDGTAYMTRGADGYFAGGLTVTAAEDMTDELFWVNGNTVGISGIDFNGGATALVTGSNSFVTVADSVFENFTAGAIYDNGSLILDGVVVRNNSGTDFGGIANVAGQMTIRNSSVYNNTAQQAGGILNRGALFLGSSEIDDNTATVGDGGGVLNFGTLTVFSSSLCGNAALGAGGGLAHEPTAENISNRLTLINAIVAGNTASIGGVHITGTNAQITNSTIVGNVGVSTDIPLGAGINVDLTNEQAAVASVNLSNTIVAANYNSTSEEQDNIHPTNAGFVVNVNNSSLIDGTVPLFKNFEVSSYADAAATDAWKNWDLSLSAGDFLAHDQGDSSLAVSYDGTRLARDYFGDARIMGQSIDIGAVEYSTKLVVTTLVDEFEGPYLGADGFVDGDIINGSDEDGHMRTDIATVGTGLSLREAIYWVEHDHLTDVVIVFHNNIAGGTITLDAAKGELLVSSNLSISGKSVYNAANQTNGITISGDNATRIFNVASGANTLSVGYVNFVEGNAQNGSGGAFYVGENSNLDLIYVNLNSNTAVNGGAICAEAGTQVILDDSTVSFNTASGSGGAIASLGDVVSRYTDFTSNAANGNTSTGGAISITGNGLALIEAGRFTDNSAYIGGAVSIDSSADAMASIIYNNASFINNSARYDGGAVVLKNGTLAVYNVAMNNNTAGHMAGAFFIHGTAVVSEVAFTGNISTHNGGALYNDGGSICTISSSTFDGNSSKRYGGAVANYNNGDMKIYSSDFTSNYAKTYAGALGNWGTLFIGESTFDGNSSGYCGGAMGVSAGTVTLYLSSFVNNTSVNDGGVMHIAASEVTVYGSTFANNSSGDDGGALVIHQTGTLNIYSGADIYGKVYATTFDGNTAKRSGGAIANCGTVNLSSDIVNGTMSDPFIYFYNNKVVTTSGETSEILGFAYAESRTASTNITQSNVFLDNSGDIIQSVWGSRFSANTTANGSLKGSDLGLSGNKKLLVDLQNNGTFTDITNTSLADLGLGVGTHELAVIVVDDNGVQSQAANLTLVVSDAAPAVVSVQKASYAEDQIVKLTLDVDSQSGSAIKQWSISWGDGETSTIDSLSAHLEISHYYKQSGEYSISMEIVDTNDLGAGIVYQLATHTVPVQEAAAIMSQTTSMPLLAPQSAETETEPTDVPVDENALEAFQEAAMLLVSEPTAKTMKILSVSVQTTVPAETSTELQTIIEDCFAEADPIVSDDNWLDDLEFSFVNDETADNYKSDDDEEKTLEECLSVL